jgi:hypothetical protein
MSIRAASLSLAFVALTASLSAQQPKVFAPHEPIPPKAAKQVKWLNACHAAFHGRRPVDD